MTRPLIAADVPGCRDVVEEGINGHLCAVRSSASLASAMMKIARMSKQQRQTMGEAGRRKVEERFSEEFVVQAYLDVLASLNPAYAVA